MQSHPKSPRLRMASLLQGLVNGLFQRTFKRTNGFERIPASAYPFTSPLIDSRAGGVSEVFKTSEVWLTFIK
jgi:hypothetical protein